MTKMDREGSNGTCWSCCCPEGDPDEAVLDKAGEVSGIDGGGCEGRYNALNCEGVTIRDRRQGRFCHCGIKA